MKNSHFTTLRSFKNSDYSEKENRKIRKYLCRIKEEKKKENKIYRKITNIKKKKMKRKL